MIQIYFGKMEMNAMENMVRFELCPFGVWLEISPVISQTLDQLEKIFLEAGNDALPLKQKNVVEFISKAVPDIRSAVWAAEPIVDLPAIKCFAMIGDIKVSISAVSLTRLSPTAERIQSEYNGLCEIGDKLINMF